MVLQSPPAGTKKKGKKRRISKHIVNSRLPSFKNENEAEPGIESAHTLLNKSQPITVVKEKKVSKKRRNVKDPTDVAGYLTAWKNCQEEHQIDNSVSVVSSKISWKFNKNTQSWLIRHLYDGSKVTKSVFNDAILYFGKANDAVQERLRQDATMRALRYQQYNSKKETEQEDMHSQVDTPLKEATGTSMDPKSNVSKTPDEKSFSSVIGFMDDAQWLQLNDHDRRKEYKRARKLLETLAVSPNERSTQE